MAVDTTKHHPTVDPSMPVYDRSTPTAPSVVDRFARGVSWMVHPDERGRRTSHAVRAPDGIWLFDPLDAPGLDDVLASVAPDESPTERVAGIVVCGNYHRRDAGVLAERYGVPVSVPGWMDGVATELEDDVPVHRIRGTVGDSGFRIRRCEPFPGWREAFLYRPDDSTLYVPDSLGTTPLHTTASERLGVTLIRRPQPPRAQLADLSPERILVGHGTGVHEGAATALADALDGARQRLPRALVGSLGTQLRAIGEAVIE